jgi:hypothetical protein
MMNKNEKSYMNFSKVVSFHKSIQTFLPTTPNSVILSHPRRPLGLSFLGTEKYIGMGIISEKIST